MLEDSTSDNLFQAGQLLVSLAPIPGLAAVVIAAQEIYKTCQRIKQREQELLELARYTGAVLEVLNQSYQPEKHSTYAEALAGIRTVVFRFQEEAKKWAAYGRGMSFFKNSEILDAIKLIRVDLEGAIAMLGLQSSINQDAWNKRFDEAQMVDHQLLLDISRKQQEMDQRMIEMQTILKSWSPTSGVDPRNSTLTRTREEVYRLRNAEDQPVLPIRELNGEVHKIGARPAHAGAAFDIWKGLWLNEYLVALKVFRGVHPSEKDMARINRQIDLWRTLKHPNVLRLYGVCRLDNVPNPPIYFVSPWFKYKDAMNYIATNPQADRLRLIYEAAKGLQYLHSMSIAHGNLQGTNVLVSLNGSAVLSDFSASKVLDGGAMFTQSNGPQASLRWMSPEAHNMDSLTPKSDVYSWGMTALQILSGQRPYYKIKAMGQLVVSIVIRHIKPERSEYMCEHIADDRIWNLLNRCWETDPERRPTVEDILYEVGAVRSSRGWDGHDNVSQEAMDTDYPSAF